MGGGRGLWQRHGRRVATRETRVGGNSPATARQPTTTHHPPPLAYRQTTHISHLALGHETALEHAPDLGEGRGHERADAGRDLEADALGGFVGCGGVSGSFIRR